MDFDFSLAPPQLTDIENLQATVDELWLSCRRFTSEINELKEKLNINPQNSSLPPSTVPPFKHKQPTPAQKKWWQSKPGAVLGHKGYGRRLLPLDQVHEIVTCLPNTECSHCGATVKTLKSYSRKQLFDLPLGRLHVTEYQLHRGRCIGCKKRSSALMPESVPKHLLGRYALARIALITGKYHLSKRLTAQLLVDLFGLKLSIGTISNAEAKVAQALARSIEEIEKEVKASERLHADETSFFLKNKLRWLWVASSEQATLFKIFAKRDTASAKELIGEDYKGLVSTDRFGSYNWLKPEQHQYCWAHIIRDFRKISERDNAKEAYLGCVLLNEAKTIIHSWNKLQENSDAPISFLHRRCLKELPDLLRMMLQRGMVLTGTKTARFCRFFLNHWDCLWHFIHQANVDPTNNKAERALRSAVIWRKLSYGVQSLRGILYVERMLSVVETCRQKGVSTLIFIENALVAG